MELTAAEKQKLIAEINNAIGKDVLQKEDAVAIIDILLNATKRKRNEMVAEHPWLEPSDIVQ